MDDDGVRVSIKPWWVAPALVLIVVLGLSYVGRKKNDAVENPIVDLAIITVAVFAFAALFRKIAHALDAPGMATFFGAPVQPHPDHVNNVDTAGDNY